MDFNCTFKVTNFNMTVAYYYKVCFKKCSEVKVQKCSKVEFSLVKFSL